MTLEEHIHNNYVNPILKLEDSKLLDDSNYNTIEKRIMNYYI